MVVWKEISYKSETVWAILPASILKRLNLSAKDPVTITHRNNSIIIKPVPRRNWEAAASQMHAAGDDNLIMPDILEDEKMEGLEW